MQIQLHPASGRRAVRTFSLGETGERLLIAAAAILLVLFVSLWVTVPRVVAGSLREGEERLFTRDLETRRADWVRASEVSRSLRQRALDAGDLVNRIAFLYALPAGQWPRVLNSEQGFLAAEEPDRVASALELYLRGLERARAMIADREQEDPDLPRRAPAVVPIRDAMFEPSAFFGPRNSPWTGEEEFFLGVDFAAPSGSAVVATGAGTVVFAGTVRRAMAGWFWRLGNIVVLSHGKSGATVYGHLARIDVRRGQIVARGERLGSVGATGWAISPQLHYECWRSEGERLRPTDPLFGTLDRRLGRRPLSLEQMEATSAPGPLDPIPGIQVSALQAAGHEPPAARAPRHRARKRRI
jgi:murein DD-endopeptidase MepM/ murein hydrolase activator NlpD